MLLLSTVVILRWLLLLSQDGPIMAPDYTGVFPVTRLAVWCKENARENRVFWSFRTVALFKQIPRVPSDHDAMTLVTILVRTSGGLGVPVEPSTLSRQQPSPP